MREKPSLLPFVLVSFLLALVFTAVAEAQSNTATTILDDFVGRTSPWWGHMRNAALQLFKVTATLEIGLFGIRMVMAKSQFTEIVGQFVMTLVFMIFIWMVIVKFEEWSQVIAITGLRPLAGSLSGNETFNVGSPFALIIRVLVGMGPVLKDAGINDIGMVMIYVVCMAFVIAVFAFMCLKYILVICEFHICANVGLVMIGLGGSKIFKDYAINVMKYVLSVGIKIFVITLIFNIGFEILTLQDMAKGMGNTQTIETINLGKLVSLVFQGIILLGLAQTLPETCAGILTGASVSGGNPLASMGQAMGSAAVGMAVAQAKSMGEGIKQGHALNKLANQAGITDPKARAAFKSNALEQAKMNANPSSVSNQLKSMFKQGQAGGA